MSQKIIHKLIAKTAKEMAAAFYEDAAHDNLFYRFHPTLRRFVAANWKHFIQPARQVLTAMLAATKPDGTPLYPPQMLDPIYEALVIDGSFKATPQARTSSLIH